MQLEEFKGKAMEQQPPNIIAASQEHTTAKEEKKSNLKERRTRKLNQIEREIIKLKNARKAKRMQLK